MESQDGNERGPHARRQYLTLLFADVSGSSVLSELMEAEEYAALLIKLRSLCRQIISRHGGQIARIQGDGLLAFFGWPKAREDDGRRATTAALELHSAVARIGSEIRLPEGRNLRLHSGIHAGLALVSRGDLERGRFELLGNAPNVAAQLSNLAPEDGIVVSEETLGPHREFFTTGEPQAVRIKREVPLVVYQVLGRASTSARFATGVRGSKSPLVGREVELRKLHEHLLSALAGNNECCVISAPAGMGKSRLMEELIQRAHDERIVALRGFAEDHLGAVPLQPFLHILRGLAEPALPSAPQLSVPLIERARALLDAGPEAQGESVLRKCVELLADVASAIPLLIVVDDWQWADEASQRVLEGLRAVERSLMVVVGTRLPPDDLLLARPAATVVLEPLDNAAAARLVSALLPDADSFVVSDIYRHAGGNPLYLEELCQAVQAPGTSWRSQLKLAGTAWLSALIESRVARLSAGHAKVVRSASVLGNVFPGWLLERMTGYGPEHAVVRELATADLIYPGEQPGTLRFKHGITRDVIYETVGLHQRQRLHLQIADALKGHDPDGDQHVEALAYHCAAARDYPSAADYADRAGDKAMSASALDRARSQYMAALGAMDALTPVTVELELRWCAVAQKLAMACVFDPLALPDGVSLFERALAFARHTGRSDVVARVEYWIGYVLYAKGRANQAARHCEEALRVAVEIGEQRLAAQVRSVYGQVLLSGNQHDRALGFLNEALKSRRPPEGRVTNISVGAAYTLACKAYLLGDRGQFTLAEECFEEAFQLIGEARHQVASSVRHWRCVVMQWQGRWGEALRMADDAADIAEYTRSRQQLLMGRAMASYIRWVLSRRSEELQGLREATAWVDARDGRLAMSLNYGWMVEVASASGLEEEARYHAARLFQRSRQADRLGEALGCRALALAAAKVSNFTRAERYLSRANQAAVSRNSAHELACNQLCEAQIMLDRGDGSRALALLEAAASTFEAMQMTWHLERTRRLMTLEQPTASFSRRTPS